MRRFKYIIVDDTYPRICSEAELHRDLAGWQSATSAGFGSLGMTPEGRVEVSVCGKSVSLNDLASKPGDAALIERMFQDPA